MKPLGILLLKGRPVNHRSLVKLFLNPLLRVFKREIGSVIENKKLIRYQLQKCPRKLNLIKSYWSSWNSCNDYDEVLKFPYDDPVKNCKLYKEESCSHVDGPICDFGKCSMLEDYVKEHQTTTILESDQREIECPRCDTEFIVEEFQDGKCPICGKEYTWDQNIDFNPEYEIRGDVFVVWEKK
jgi:endogenous inhibitor of DNA gyrase (YacG/DUF329 family)